MRNFRPLFIGNSRELFRGIDGKENGMTSVMGVGPSSLQASAAVFNINAEFKTPPEKRDDVVPPIAETTNGQAAKSDLNLLKMADPSVGRTVDIKA